MRKSAQLEENLFGLLTYPALPVEQPGFWLAVGLLTVCLAHLSIAIPRCV